MPNARLDSMLLSSSDPRRLAEFYGRAFELNVETTPDGGYQLINIGGFYVMFDSRDDVSGASSEPGRVIFNVDVTDAKATAASIEAAGGTWVSPLEDRDGSFFGTAADPDGNYVQIIQLSEQHLKEMEAMMAS